MNHIYGIQQLRRLFPALLVLSLLLSGCGQAIKDIDWTQVQRGAGTAISTLDDLRPTLIITATPNATEIALYGVSTPIDVASGSPDSVESIATQQIEPTVVTNVLGTVTDASFDRNKGGNLDVSGREYTLGECVEYHCLITLQPDGAQVWVRRELLGLEKYVLPPAVQYVAYTPTPAPPCLTVNSSQGSVIVCGWGDLQAQAEQEYVNKFGGNITDHPTMTPWQ